MRKKIISLLLTAIFCLSVPIIYMPAEATSSNDAISQANQEIGYLTFSVGNIFCIIFFKMHVLWSEGFSGKMREISNLWISIFLSKSYNRNKAKE